MESLTRKIAPAIAVALLISPATGNAQEIRYAPDYAGRLMVEYRPVQCVRAPCPAGIYIIEGDGFSARAHTLIIEHAGATSEHTGQYLDIDRFIGGVWVGGATSVDIDGTPLPADVVSIQVAPHNRAGR
jgi:hypothetical protein